LHPLFTANSCAVPIAFLLAKAVLLLGTDSGVLGHIIAIGAGKR